MTKFTRHVKAFIENTDELRHKLFSFVSLIIMTSVEALFLFIFTRVHEKVDAYLHHSPWCPMKIAVVVMGTSFLLLNVVIVLTFVASEIFTTINSLRSFVSKKGEKRRNIGIRNPKETVQPRISTSIESRKPNVMITVTVCKETKVSSSTLSSPAARRTKHVQEEISAYKRRKPGRNENSSGQPCL